MGIVRLRTTVHIHAFVILINGCAELYAGTLRVVLWTRGQLSELQAEMALKNIAFLYNVYSASDMYTTTKRRDWNTRDLGCGLQFPQRETQLVAFRWGFILSYLCQGALMSQVLSAVTPASQAYRWQSNTGFDLVMVAVFYVYCSDCSVRRRYVALVVHYIALCLYSALCAVCGVLCPVCCALRCVASALSSSSLLLLCAVAPFACIGVLCRADRCRYACPRETATHSPSSPSPLLLVPLLPPCAQGLG